MSRAFSNIKRTLLAAAGVVAGMALGAEGQLSMGMAEAWTWVEVPGVAWSAWETRVASAAEGLAESARSVPPMPRGSVAYLGQGVEEWPSALATCMEVVSPSVTVGGVSAWEVRVTEWVGEDGARQWVTHCGGVALHAQAVPARRRYRRGLTRRRGRLPFTRRMAPCRILSRKMPRCGRNGLRIVAGSVWGFRIPLSRRDTLSRRDRSRPFRRRWTRRRLRDWKSWRRPRRRGRSCRGSLRCGRWCPRQGRWHLRCAIRMVRMWTFWGSRS